MFLKYVTGLLPTKAYSPKCNLHKFSRLSDVYVKDAVGKRMKVQGWVYGVRKLKTNIFLDISDGSTNEMLQIIVNKSADTDGITYGSSVMAEGEFAQAPNGRLELQASEIRLIGPCDINDGYPFFPKKDYHPDYVRQYLHLRVRKRDFAALLRMRDLACAAICENFRSRGFINIHTPILTSNICENAGEIFSVQPNSGDLINCMKKEDATDKQAFFNSDVYLTLSGQLHLEAMARAFTKVYTFGPTFRAENSRSRFHLSEFYMAEAEIAFIERIEDLMEEVELLVKNVTQNILDKGSADFKYLKSPEPEWLNQKFGCISYDEAITILQSNAEVLNSPIHYGQALSKEHELFLVKHNNGIPIFVINWPKEAKPFYMKEYKDDPSKVAALDLLGPTIGELVGGGMREDDYNKLLSKLPGSGKLSWYTDLRKHGNVLTGGFGMGFERYLQCVLGIPNIKDTIPFPRWPHNCFT